MSNTRFKVGEIVASFCDRLSEFHLEKITYINRRYITTSAGTNNEYLHYLDGTFTQNKKHWLLPNTNLIKYLYG